MIKFCWEGVLRGSEVYRTGKREQLAHSVVASEVSIYQFYKGFGLKKDLLSCPTSWLWAYPWWG